MRRIALLSMVGGCLWNPSVEVDREAVEIPRGTSTDVVVSIDGAPVADLAEVLWSVDDPALVTVTPHGDRLAIGGNLEGSTVVHVSSHGQTVDIAARVRAPAIVKMWIEPTAFIANVGADVQVKAVAVDTLFRLVDITHDCRWAVRNEDVARLDMAGMMLRAETEGETSLHAGNGTVSAMVPITILK
jgi:hypothetical protein